MNKYILGSFLSIIVFVFAFFVFAETDTTEPIITNVRAENIIYSGAQIKWTTDDMSDSKIYYGTASGNYNLSASSRCDAGGNVTEHCLNLTGLAYSTIYYYMVISTNSSGLYAQKSDFQFTSGSSSGGGGGGSTSPTPTPTYSPTPTPTYSPTPTPTPSTSSGPTASPSATPTPSSNYLSLTGWGLSVDSYTGKSTIDINFGTSIDSAYTNDFYIYIYKVGDEPSKKVLALYKNYPTYVNIIPDSVLTPGVDYISYVRSSVKSTSGLSLSSDYVCRFTALASGYYNSCPNVLSGSTSPTTYYSPTPTPTYTYSPTPMPTPSTSSGPTASPSATPTPTPIPIVNATLVGKVIDSQGGAVAGAWYHVFRDDYSLNFDGTTDSGGYFKITIPAGYYAAEIFPPKTFPGLLRPDSQKFNVSNGESKSLIFKFESGSKIIVGTVLFSNGQPVTDAEVGAYSKDTGQWKSMIVDQNGKFTLEVSGGRWEIGARPKDGMASWYFPSPYPVVEFLQDGTSETKQINLSIPTPDAKLIVRTVDDNGVVLPYVGVVVDIAGAGQYLTTSSVTQSLFAKSDSNGLAMFNLKPGSYYIRSYLPGESGYINPTEQYISINSGETKDIKVVFRKQNIVTAVFIKGTTKLDDGRPIDAYVWAWSEKGGFTNTRSESGSFMLQVVPNSSWHISAGKEFEGLAYKSSEVIVPIGESSVFTEIVLSKFSEVPLPKPATVTSTASQQIVVQTTDGARLFVPPDSVASNVGNLTVEVKPTIEVPSQAAAKVIGTAYDVVIKNPAGQELKTFEKELEISLPYNEADIKAQGLTEDSISPSYYDETTGNWVRAENYTIDKEKNVIIVRAKHLTRYAIVAAADILPPADVSGVSGIALGGGKIKLAWTNPTKDFSHVKIYQSELSGSLGKIAASEVVGSEYVNEGVINGITYYYTIRSVDPAGNESATTKQTGIKAIGTSIQKPMAYGFNDGDVVSATGSDDPDVYIVNIHGYKRLFLNPAIFNFYGHLGGFAKVKNTTPAARDKFITSGLFRNCETNDPKVYGVEVTGEDIGTLHWVNTTGEQAVFDDPNFFNKVFCINSREFNWYQKGGDYTSINQIPAYSRK